MLIDRNWYPIEEAVAKYGIDEQQILAWIDEGVVRSEERNGQPVMVNGDDLELKVAERSETL